MAASASPAVAVIVPVFNRARLIVEALDSIAAQSRAPSRVVVVDDGSTDDTAERVDAWVRRKPASLDARLIRQPNRGAPAARNHAIAEAGPVELLAFLDSDDLWPPDFLARTTAALDADPPAVAVTTDHVESNAATGEQRRVPAAFDGRITENILHGRLPLPSCTVVRAAAVRAAGGFNESYRRGLEDVELFLCMSLRGPWRSVPGEPVIRRVATAGVFGGPEQLSASHLQQADSTRQTLRLFDRFLFDLGGAKAVDLPAWSRRFAPLWWQWLHEALARGDGADATECGQHILAHDGGDPQVAGQLALLFRRAGRAAEDAGDLRAAAAWHRRCWHWNRRSLHPLFRSWRLRLQALFRSRLNRSP